LELQATLPRIIHNMQAQPLIFVRDVQSTGQWYQRVLGLASDHGGPDYEQLMFGENMILQLHRWDAHEHPNPGKPDVQPVGNGVVLWFHEAEIRTAFKRAVAAGAEVIEALKVNPRANHQEFWLRDPNGYIVVVAGSYGDTSEGQP
jgi:catechol 2,3-dioxygenase-like lactoylglutathione lyase family enzyme